MPALEVIDPGLHTTIQDLGRVGYRDSGIPSSGPLDSINFRLANAIVGNAVGTPALEILMLGPTLRVKAASVRVALAGCSAEIEIGGHGSKRVRSGQSVRLVRDDIFRVRSLRDSFCAYIAIEAGPDVAPILGSVSTYARGMIGGFQGRRLQQGDALPLRLDSVETRDERSMTKPFDSGFDQPIRVILGPQADYFTNNGIQTLLSSNFKVSHLSDRMGYRLDGPAIEHSKGYNIVSDGIVSGSIQVPGSGKPIVLMVDNPTTGGYPKIATVISADIPVIARRTPGRTVRFTGVKVNEAQLLREQQEQAIQQELKAISHGFHGF